MRDSPHPGCANDAKSSGICSWCSSRGSAPVGLRQALTSILEPVMIVFVGGIVGFIVIAMYLPIFSLYDKIG